MIVIPSAGCSMTPGEKSKYDAVGSWVMAEKTAGEMSSNTKVQTKILKSCDRENKLKRDIRCQIKECEERISYLSCFRRKGDYFFVLSFCLKLKYSSLFGIGLCQYSACHHENVDHKRNCKTPLCRGCGAEAAFFCCFNYWVGDKSCCNTISYRE